MAVFRKQAKQSGHQDAFLRLGLLGFGEAGKAIAASLYADFSMTIMAYDHAFRSDYARAEQQNMTGVILCSTCEELATSSDIIISVVTADEAVNATTSIAPFMLKNHFFLDGNSVSPCTKGRSADIVKSYNAGVTYLEIFR